MIYTVTLNPALDKTAVIPNFTLDRVNRVSSLRTDPGGKGINVSKVIAALGGESTALGILGGQCGKAVAESLKAIGLTCDFIFVPGETRTNLKVVDPVRHTNTDLNEPGLAVTREVLEELLGRLAAKLREGDIVVLAGSLPDGAPRTLYADWCRACGQRGARVFLDADGDLLAEGLKASPWLVKPNSDELSRLAGRQLTGISELAAEGRRLMEGGVQRVVISLGGNGALFLESGGTWLAHGLKVPVGSTVGAGDSMIAALAYSLQQGYGLEQTIRLSIAVSAANAMCSGTQAAGMKEAQPLLEQVTYERLA